jgi:L-alanine-DL-glutamate epimerase-like enolase superfamily enzyme
MIGAYRDQMPVYSMVDANQALNRNESLRRGRVYQEMGCFWYEEPLPPHDMDDYASISSPTLLRARGPTSCSPTTGELVV